MSKFNFFYSETEQDGRFYFENENAAKSYCEQIGTEFFPISLTRSEVLRLKRAGLIVTSFVENVAPATEQEPEQTEKLVDEIQEAEVIESEYKAELKVLQDTPQNPEIQLLQNQFSDVLQQLNELRQENQELKKGRSFKSPFEMAQFLKDRENLEKRLSMYTKKLEELDGLNFSEIPYDENGEITNVTVTLSIQKGTSYTKVSTSNKDVVKQQFENWKELIKRQIHLTQTDLKNYEL